MSLKCAKVRKNLRNKGSRLKMLIMYSGNIEDIRKQFMKLQTSLSSYSSNIPNSKYMVFQTGTPIPKQKDQKSFFPLRNI